VIAVFDMDGEGLIELPEFLTFVKSQYNDAVSRIRDMTESQAMAQSIELGKRYAPPRDGTVYLEVMDSYRNKDSFALISSTTTNMSASIAAKMGDISTLLSYAFQHSQLRLTEAFSFYETMYKDMDDKAAVLVKLLPQMATSSEPRQLISKVTNDDKVLVSRVKQMLGPAMRPIYGMSNGFYSLNLSKESDLICLGKLLELSTTACAKRKAANALAPGVIGDTSQKGNWSCFRNECLNGEPVAVSIQTFTPMPRSGRLHFDYSSCSRTETGQSVMSDMRY
jgi:hypothetical protein